MRHSDLPSRIGARRRVTNVILLGCLLGGGIAGFAPWLEAAQTRVWSAEGDGIHWSQPGNWVPRGAPQPGDNLEFGTFPGAFSDTPGDMVNDLTGLSVGSMTFDGELDFFSTQWFVTGNDITITGDIACTPAKNLHVQINCGVTLGQSLNIRLDVYGDNLVTIGLNGPLDLNGHNLRLISAFGDDPGDMGVFRINSTISGPGDIRLVNGMTEGSALAVFGGSQANPFTGTLSVEREPGARPFVASFDKPGGNIVNTRLAIGDGCEVTLQRADQIGDDAMVSITGGGRLLLNGHAETLGSLLLTNVHADADPTLVDATGTTLTLSHAITTSVFNEDGNIPTIKGRLALAPGPHIFDLNNALLGPGIDLQGPIGGAGGFSKFGNATLVLATSNSFSGPVAVHDGILDIQDANALGTTSSGLTVTDGTLILRRVFILGEKLFVRGTRSVTANTAGSFLTCVDFGSWGGPIQLDTNLVVHSTGQFTVGGPIVGPGGFEFLGARNHLSGGGDSTYTGLVRSLCELLTVSDEHAFRGPLIVGGGFSPLCEVRWDIGVLNQGVPEVTVHTNGLVNLNGRTETFSRLTFNSGRVTTGSGVLSVARITVNPTNVTATIDGNLRLAAFPLTTFAVADGPANPDLTINAVVSDGFGSGIQKTGEGLMTLHRANTYGGATRVEAGTLGVLNNNALGATSQGTIIEDGATVAFGVQANTVLEPFTIAGAGVGSMAGALQTVGDVFINANIVLSGAAAILTEGTNSRVQVNNISGTGPLTKLGSGRLVLRGNANNTYSGDTFVNEGTLDLAKPFAITSVPGHLVIGGPAGILTGPTARVEHRSSFTIIGSVTVNAGGLWDLNGASEGWGIPELQGRPPLTLNNGGGVETGAGIFFLPVGGNIVVNPGQQRIGNSSIAGRIGLDPGPHRISVAQGGSSVLGGLGCNVTAAISETSGAADLEKDGGGTLRLGGTNTHRGVTLVTGGTLQVDGVQPQSAARVVDGGRLQGLGTVGLVELLGATATVAPGATPSFLVTGSGILTCSNFNVGAAQDGVFHVELNGTTPGSGYDQVNARGNVRITGLRLQGSLGFVSSIGQQFTIINNDGADAVVGTFEGLPQNASLYIGGEQFTIGYTGGTGNDVVLTRIPTPPLPRLTIQAVPPSSVRLLWPTNATGFSLQSNTNLNTNVWSTTALLPSVVGTNHVALDFTTNGLRFYRLFHP